MTRYERRQLTVDQTEVSRAYSPKEKCTPESDTGEIWRSYFEGDTSNWAIGNERFQYDESLEKCRASGLNERSL